MSVNIRSAAVKLHRWAGLLMAVFLVITGITGAVISWDHELDEVLNPHLTKTSSSGQAQDPLVLARQLEQRNPTVQVSYFDMAAEPGHSLSFWVQPRPNPQTGELYEIDYNQVFVDPVTGEELGRREWGAVWPITSETFVSFLYKLHFSLHLPEFAGIDEWGVWLLGIIALIWTIDCFTGFYLTLPPKRRKRSRASSDASTDAEDDLSGTEATAVSNAASYWQRWKPAWQIRKTRNSYKLNFDLHRAFSLWTWALLFVIAFTAFSLNLYREVFFPIMSAVSDVTPTPFDQRKPTPLNEPITPNLSFAQAIEAAKQEASVRAWQEPVGSLWHARNVGIYRVEFFSPEDGHGAGGVGHKALYVDSLTGEVLGDWIPWQGTAADIFVQAQFPVHSGRILGLPGRILISLMGLVVAMLSITGVVIWWRKKQARDAASARAVRDTAIPAGGLKTSH